MVKRTTLIAMCLWSSWLWAKVEVVTESFPPFAYIENNQVEGIVTDRVRQIMSLSGLPYSLAMYPWARSYNKALSEPNVVIYSLYQTPKRMDKFHWFCPIYPATPVYLVKLKSNHADIKDLHSLSGLSVGVTRNDNSHQYFIERKLIEPNHIDVVGDPMTNIFNLVEGRIDVIVQTRESLAFRAQRLGLSVNLFELGAQLHSEVNNQHCMALSKSSSEHVLSAIESAFAQYTRSIQQGRDEKNGALPY